MITGMHTPSRSGAAVIAAGLRGGLLPLGEHMSAPAGLTR
jgi:hypothetical protein